YRTDDPRPPGQDFIVLTPENVNSTFSADQTNYAAYGEQVFEFARWDLRAGMRFDRDGFAEESLLSPRLAANYRFSPVLRLSAAAGIFYQSPRYLDRAANAD
ncbi:MAG: TonB-dependent receptor, partial [Planctomycetales bacterium]|nr:TonB-dependent receptor [Planctomycetales bacterium]